MLVVTYVFCPCSSSISIIVIRLTWYQRQWKRWCFSLSVGIMLSLTGWFVFRRFRCLWSGSTVVCGCHQFANRPRVCLCCRHLASDLSCFGIAWATIALYRDHLCCRHPILASTVGLVTLEGHMHRGHMHCLHLLHRLHHQFYACCRLSHIESSIKLLTALVQFSLFYNWFFLAALKWSVCSCWIRF